MDVGVVFIDFSSKHKMAEAAKSLKKTTVFNVFSLFGCLVVAMI